jgi:hypothetical protein
VAAPPEDGLMGLEWEFDLGGYDETLQRPIVRGWRLASHELHHEAANLHVVEVEAESLLSVHCHPNLGRVVVKRGCTTDDGGNERVD